MKVRCVHPEALKNYRMSFEGGKLYDAKECQPPELLMLCVVDETGEEYIYPRHFFEIVETERCYLSIDLKHGEVSMASEEHLLKSLAPDVRLRVEAFMKVCAIGEVLYLPNLVVFCMVPEGIYRQNGVTPRLHNEPS